MATMTTHCLVGEAVFPHLPHLDPASRSSFLLGCMLVDVHILYPDYRLETHFYAGDPLEGVNLSSTCHRFLARLDEILIRPWAVLTPSEQAFAAGYLCHLAADEAWKQMDRESAQTSGARWWKDLPVPPGVTLTVFDELLLSQAEPHPFSQVLGSTPVPNIFNHVPYAALQELWAIIQPHIASGGTSASYFSMLARLGKTSPEIRTALQEYDQHHLEAVHVIDKYLKGVPARMNAMYARSLEQVPRLWDR